MEKNLPLEELEKRLYERRKPPPPEKPLQPNILPEPVIPPSPPRGLSPRTRRRFVWWLGAVVVLAAVLAIFIFLRGFTSFSKSRVEIEIERPQQLIIVAGEVVPWLVTVRNKNRTTLEDGELTFQFPENSLNPESSRPALRETRTIGKLEPGQSREEVFSAVVIGGEGFEREAVASLRFRPAGSSLILQNQEKSTITIERFPVEVLIAGPAEVLSGERISVNLRLTNEGSRAFTNLRVRIEYPSGFSFEESKEPLGDFNTTWSLGSVLPREERVNEITGVVNGLEGEGKIFRVFVEYREQSGWRAYKEVTNRADVQKSPLDLSLRLFEEAGGAVSLSSPLTYEINWRNNTDVPVTGLILTAELEGTLFNLGSLSASGEISANSIRWTQAQIPVLGALRPGESGSVTFRLNAKDSFTSASRNPVLKVSVRLENSSIDFGRFRETKVNGGLNLTASASPSGAATFTVRWRVGALANEFKNVKVKTVLPSGVSWAGGGASYDDKTREVVWETGNIGANQTLEKTFTVSLNSPPGAGETASLISESELTGEDIFTGSKVLKIESPVEIEF